MDTNREDNDPADRWVIGAPYGGNQTPGLPRSQRWRVRCYMPWPESCGLPPDEGHALALLELLVQKYSGTGNHS